VLEDKFLPSLIAGVAGEVVASTFKSISTILTGNVCGKTKAGEIAITEVPFENGIWRGFGTEKQEPETC